MKIMIPKSTPCALQSPGLDLESPRLEITFEAIKLAETPL